MRYILLLLTVVTPFFTNVRAQSAEDSVKAVINQLFEAMRKTDPDMLMNTFADSAILQTIRGNRDGSFYVHNEDPAMFASSVGKAKKDSLDERITFGSVLVDGPLASVWTPYRFYYAGQFSHCGVNSFQLVRIRGVWKIQYLVDTRRRQDCE
jgi:hypothetical protein